MSIFASCALVLANYHFTTIWKNCKIHDFQELFIWLLREHYFSQLLCVLGGSSCLLGALGANGSSWRRLAEINSNHRFIKQTDIFHFPGLLLTCPMSCILDHWKSWKPLFCRTLDPRLENHEIELPGTGFNDFWSQGQKVIKSSLLGLVVPTSGAKASKSINRAPWDCFCGLVEPRLESH